MFDTRWMSSTVNFLTVHDDRHVLDEAVNNLESLSCSCPSLIFCESVQPLEDRLDVFLCENFLDDFDCVALSKVTGQRKRTHSVVPD